MKKIRSLRMRHVMQVVNVLAGLRVFHEGGGGRADDQTSSAREFGFVSSLYVRLTSYHCQSGVDPGGDVMTNFIVNNRTDT